MKNVAPLVCINKLFLGAEINLSRVRVVIYGPTWCTFQSKLEKNKKIHPEKNCLYFWKFLALILENFLNFLIFQETGTLKKLLIFREIKLFSPPRENFLYFRKQKPDKFSYIFWKESFSYISGNGNLGKSLLYSRKQNFVIFQETELSYISRKVYSEP